MGSPVKGLRLVGITVMLAGSLAGCGLLPTRGVDFEGYWLPLTVVVRFNPSVTDATLAYTDACQQP